MEKWPRSTRENVTSIQKIIKSESLRGFNQNERKMYLRQVTENVNTGRLFRNTNVSTIPDGSYLYLIEYDPGSKRYYKQFVEVLSSLELGSRHFQLPTRNPGRIIVAAGELLKKGSKVVYNFESGTYMKNIMRASENNSRFHAIIRDAFKNANALNFTNQILVPNVPTKLKNLLRFLNSGKGSVSYGFGPRNTEHLRKNALARLRQLHRNRVEAGESSQNENQPNKRRRSARLASKK